MFADSLYQYKSLRNGNEIICAIGAVFLFVFKALKPAHSKLCNCFCNTEDRQKDKSFAQVIKFTFLRVRFLGALCWILTSFQLSGCSVIGPDFKLPEIELKEEWLAQHEATVKRGDYRYWWRVFNDSTLNQLIETAYRQNLELQTAAIRILEARAQLGIARGSLFPQTQNFGTNVAYNKLSERSPNFDDSFDDSSFVSFQMGFDALWELDVWGRFRRGIESANAKLAMSQADYDDVLVSLTAEVAISYVQICTFQQRLLVARANEKIQQESLHITTVRMKEGISTELDMQQAKALFHSTQALISTLEIGLRQSKNALSVLLGKFPSEIENLFVETYSVPSVEEEIIFGIPTDMLRRRPDVRKAEFKAVAQNALIGVAKADLLPRFTLRGALGLNSSNTGALDIFDIFDMKSLAATVGPTVSWPILNYGRLKNNVRVQDARFEQSLLNYRHTVLRAVQEVEDAMVAFVKTKSQMDNLQQSVFASNRSVSLALIQYRDGIEDYTRVLNSQQFLVEQQDMLIKSQGQYAKNIIAVYKALGGGWEIREEKQMLPEETMQRMQQRTDWGAM